MTERRQKTRLNEMLNQIKPPDFNKSKLNTILYTAVETGIISEDSPLDSPETLFMLMQLSLTITNTEIHEIRM